MSEAVHLEMRKFLAPELVLGLGALGLAGRYARNLGVRRALLVSDAGVVRCGWAERAGATLLEAGVEYILFDRVSPNPRSTEVMEGAAVYREARCDGLVVVGGGSPIDAAKAIGIVVSNGGDVTRFEGVDRIEVPIPPLVCVPTTAGSAADVSQFAIISDPARKVKFAVISKALIPDCSLVDPEPLTTMPAELTAASGMDALSHAIEAYVSNASSVLTDLHALEAVRLVGRALAPCVETPDDLAARALMARASLLAGLAFSNAILGAVHALAHALGGLLDVPHGKCNALLLEQVVRFNFGAAPGRYRDVAEALGVPVAGLPDGPACEALADGLRVLRTRVGLGGTLGELGVTRAALPGLVHAAVRDPCLATNPRPAAERDLETLLERAL